MITIYQLKRPVNPFHNTNPIFPEDYRKMFHVNTHNPTIAFLATNDEIDKHDVCIIDPYQARSTSVGDLMILDRCVVLLVESVGFSYQGDLRDEDMAIKSIEIQSSMNSFHFPKGATK